MLVYEELDYIHIDDIGNIENSPRPVFIDEESGNPYQPKEEVKRFTTAYRCLLNEKCYRREYLFSSHVEYLFF